MVQMSVNNKHFLLTQFLTNHGSFRSYLHRMNKTPSPNCNCPEMTVQTAHHLMLECSLWSKDRPTVLKSLPTPLVMQYHINTISITDFLRRMFQALQEDAQGN
jgi:cobalamin biosynthesis protein CobD/CbiB